MADGLAWARSCDQASLKLESPSKHPLPIIHAKRQNGGFPAERARQNDSRLAVQDEVHVPTQQPGFMR